MGRVCKQKNIRILLVRIVRKLRPINGNNFRNIQLAIIINTTRSPFFAYKSRVVPGIFHRMFQFMFRYPSQCGGDALAELLFGVNSPSGRLPITFYYSNFTSNVAMSDMALRPFSKPDGKAYPGRTYRFFQQPVLYPFGFGLSYSKFRCAWGKATENLEGHRNAQGQYVLHFKDLQPEVQVRK